MNMYWEAIFHLIITDKDKLHREFHCSLKHLIP